MNSQFNITYREAKESDLPNLIKMLADDKLGVDYKKLGFNQSHEGFKLILNDLK